MISYEKLYKVMDKLGYRESTRGTECIRMGVEMVDKDPTAMMCKNIYPDIGKIIGQTPARVERIMRSATSTAMRSPDWSSEWKEIGGWGPPTNSEVIRRLARECQLEN